jgi:predicted transcriptional regulator
MDIVFFLKVLAGLFVLLALLLTLFVYPSRKKEQKRSKKREKTVSTEKKTLSKHALSDILALIKDKNSSTDTLKEAIEMLVKYHAKIPNKLGIRANPDFDIYEEIILRLCRHPNTNKDIILKLDRALQKENPSYARELNNALTKGLNARGV